MFGTMVLFCVSFAGYMLFIKNRFQIKSDLLPAFVCSVIVLGLYIASLAGVLAAAFWIIEWTGVFFLAETVIERILRKQPLFTWLRKLFTPGTVLFLAAMIYFSIFLSGYRWMNYDNYSHWGRLAAHLNEYNRLPSSADSLIVFQSYPPAAGLWIYYVTKAIGFSEGNALIAQAILVMSYGITLFALIPERRQWWYLPLGMVVLAFQLCISVRISDLLVDTLMALAGFASLAFLLTERNRPLKAAWLSAPVMGCLILIKNPAVLFILVDAGVLVYLLLRVRKTIRWKQAVAALAALLIPVCAYIGWNVHVRGEFPSGMNASHAMSLEHYQTVLSQKTQEEREQILQLYLEKTFSLETDATRRMVKMEIAAIAGLLALWLLNRRFPRKMLAGLLAGNLLMAVYWVMLAGMYLVSMETHAALALEQYERYLSTMQVYLAGIWTAGFFMGLSARPRGERWLQPVAAGLAAAVILILSWGYTPYQDLYIAYSSQEDKDKLAVLHSLDEQLSEMELPVPSDASYLIFGTQDIVIGEWLNPVMQMKLGTKNVLSFKWPLEEVGEMALEQWMYSFTHLLVTEDTETTRFALKYFGLETKNAKGDYNINDLLY